ncbi:MAG: DUF2330 domain-containing protein [Pirellulales bacterium]
MRYWVSLAAAVLWAGAATLDACCPAGPAGKAVVNADQTVILVWDAEKKTQHFIRKASFRSQADDVGFLVPTPSIPELEESGNDAFPLLAQITAPEYVRKSRPAAGGGCIGCAAAPTSRALSEAGVAVLAQKEVAGFHAQVLQADSADELVDWLNAHGYQFSPEVAAWAEPYVREGWKITALRVAKKTDETPDRRPPEGAAANSLAASALRISFQTDRPLFPYREPDPTAAAKSLNTHYRMLRIFFLSDARYRGELTPDEAWTGRIAWAGKLPADRLEALRGKLALPADALQRTPWLTEFEDVWPYRAAPADVYFQRDEAQDEVRRPPVILYVSHPAAFPLSIAVIMFAAAFRPRRRTGFQPVKNKK